MKGYVKKLIKLYGLCFLTCFGFMVMAMHVIDKSFKILLSLPLTAMFLYVTIVRATNIVSVLVYREEEKEEKIFSGDTSYRNN